MVIFERYGAGGFDLGIAVQKMLLQEIGAGDGVFVADLDLHGLADGIAEVFLFAQYDGAHGDVSDEYFSFCV